MLEKLGDKASNIQKWASLTGMLSSYNSNSKRVSKTNFLISQILLHVCFSSHSTLYTQPTYASISSALSLIHLNELLLLGNLSEKKLHCKITRSKDYLQNLNENLDQEPSEEK